MAERHRSKTVSQTTSAIAVTVPVFFYLTKAASLSQDDDPITITILSVLSSQKQFFSDYTHTHTHPVFTFWGAFYQKRAISKQKVQPCYFENVEMVYFDISAVVPPPCAQMKIPR